MQLRASRSFQAEPSLPPSLAPLLGLSRNLYWTWNTEAAAIFAALDRGAWERSGHNPVALLQMLPPARLERLAADHEYVERVARVSEQFDQYLSREPAPEVTGLPDQAVIAYFSLEFALTESLPNYSGGLGVLAGDHLKSASDLGLPLVGVGLLYREGYFQQSLALDGWQNEDYYDLDFATQPLKRVQGPDGGDLFVHLPIDGRDVALAVWRVDVGKVPLYVLDTDVDGNTRADRELGARLYGGDIETRIQQEIVLGIGGVRALHALGLRPVVCHMNEGHSALLGADRIRMLMEETGISFEEARLPVSAATVFTTHTAVAAGIDLFPPDLVRRYLGDYYRAMGIDDRTFLGLGRIRTDDDAEPFSMALLGVRLSGYRNGVSELHGVVSRKLWEGAWPLLPVDEIPIGSITNGVHLPTWVSHGMAEIYDGSAGRDWRDQPDHPEMWKRICDVPDEVIWNARRNQRQHLVQRVREEHRRSLSLQGITSDGGTGSALLDPEALTIGFARRFAGYKRATLLFRDPDRLARIIAAADRPVQFIFAGKAHPRDEPGKQLIREVVQFSRQPEFRGRLLMLERYDVELARALVQGCDVWLNTPLRPLEASGTSGMKAVANGALHFSVLDGWWAEAFDPSLGWAIGNEATIADPQVQDAIDAASLYQQLEDSVTSTFYTRDPAGIPHGWIAMMKASIAALAPHFSTHRMVKEYAVRAYIPSARAATRLKERQAEPARKLAAWLSDLRGNWDSMKICDIEDDRGATPAVGRPITVTVQVFLDGISQDEVQVHVVHGSTDRDGTLTPLGEEQMRFVQRARDGICTFVATFMPGRGGRFGYSVRILPSHPDLGNPFDTGLVRWG